MSTSTHTYSKQELDRIIEWFDTHSDSIRISWLPLVKSETECVYTVKWHCDGDRLAYWIECGKAVI